MACEIARLVNEVPAIDRGELRAYAVGLVREEIRGVDAVGEDDGEAGAQRPGSFSPIGMAIPILLVGALLLFLFPPVGLLLFFLAGLLVIWGVVAIVLGGRAAR